MFDWKKFRSEKPLVLIVDDVVINIKVLSEMFKDDYAVSFATNGADALQLLNNGLTPDLILLDILLPDIDGLQLCKTLKKDPLYADIPVIFITHKDRQEEELEGFAMGAVDYITKPFFTPVVCARVATHLSLKLHHDYLEKLTVSDPLTGLFNRRHLANCLEKEFRRLQRSQKPLSVIMMDIDHFKRYNDTYGHRMGDECLSNVARACAECLRRPGDIMARYGGEEFTAVLPEANAESTKRLAQNMLDAVAKLNMEHRNSPTANRVTLSMGCVTAIPTKGKKPEIWIEIADHALYQAKKAGRNRCITAEQVP